MIPRGEVSRSVVVKAKFEYLVGVLLDFKDQEDQIKQDRCCRG